HLLEGEAGPAELGRHHGREVAGGHELVEVLGEEGALTVVGGGPAADPLEEVVGGQLVGHAPSVGPRTAATLRGMSAQRVETWGTGERVVLVHGSLATGPAEWEAQRPLAAEGYELVVPTRSAYATTGAGGEDFLADGREVAELLGDGAHLVGHSYGGSSRSSRPTCVRGRCSPSSSPSRRCSPSRRTGRRSRASRRGWRRPSPADGTTGSSSST